MNTVIADISMSLDGYVTAAHRTADQPMGAGGEKLHEWAFRGDPALLREPIGRAGALVCGRRTYDDSLRWWGANGPTGEARLPLVVMTHNPLPDKDVYHFVDGGPVSALEKARVLAGDKNILIMGGAGVCQQFVRAGLADEISIHLVPVLLHDGLRLFDHLGPEHTRLEVAEIIDTPLATHLRYRLHPR